jgi:diadenosine tetraphosphatase ApaH/serine/threonine PP2A family protein phosphatase
MRRRCTAAPTMAAWAATCRQAGQRIALQPQHQYLVLPGAVGQPRDQNNAACYAVFDDEAREITVFQGAVRPRCGGAQGDRGGVADRVRDAVGRRI